MNEDLIQFLLERLDAVAAPVFSPGELPGVPPSDWELLEKKRILIRAKEPESVQLRGKLLAVRRSGDRIFGFDEDEELAKPVPLSESDLITYRVNLSGLLDELRDRNKIQGRDAASWHGFHPLGRLRLADVGMATFYLSLTNADLADTERRLNLLAGQSGIKVAVFPVWPLINTSSYANDDLYVFDLATDLSINWHCEAPGAAAPDPEYGFIGKDDKWEIHFLGEKIDVDAVIGMRYIALALQKSPESIPMRELEEEVLLTNDDKKKSENLSMRKEFENNLESTTYETMDNLKAAARNLKFKIEDAQETEDEVAEAEFKRQLKEIERRIRKDTTPSGKIRQTGRGYEADRKRISKNLKTAFALIDAKNEAIGRHLRRVKLRRGKLTHTPNTDEVWVVEFFVKSKSLPRK